MTLTDDLLSDPKVPYTWFQDPDSRSPVNMSIGSVWADYRGAGIRVGVLDSQIDFAHPDLTRAYDQSLDYNFALGTGALSFAPRELTDSHGTMVAGVIAAEGGNGIGGVGYAPDVTLVGLGLDYSSSTVTDQVMAGLRAAAALDVVNCSWSFVKNFSDDFSTPADAGYAAALAQAATAGRDGRGTAVVFSAGNGGLEGASNYHNFQNSPYAIAVGAVERSGEAWHGTSLGANVLVSAAGRSVTTTTLNDAYTNATGTSFAAPAVSAVVALMLEANPELGYRDIQRILSLSAMREGTSDDPLDGDGWRVTGADTHNGGGLHFSDAYGFGVVNAHAAVRLAETWTGTRTAADRDEVTVHRTAGVPIVAGSQDRASVEIEIAERLDVEHVALSLNLSGWPSTGDLDVYLVSPEGTSVRLLYALPNQHSNGVIDGFVFTSVATMGEMSAGTWTLHVVNRDPDLTRRDGSAMAGLLEDVTLTIYGDADGAGDDTYVYTDEFGTLYSGDDLAARRVLHDADGGTDTINAAAVTSASRVDLGTGRARIAGIEVEIRDPGGIEDIVTGDGDDVLIGNAGDNRLVAGRGDDVLHLSAGDDLLDGGAGDDVLVIDAALAALSGYLDAAGALMLGLAGAGVSRVTGVETFRMTDVVLGLSRMTELFGSGAAPEAPSKGDDVTGTPTPSPTPTPVPVPEFDSVLDGGAGDDVILGGSGRDRISGFDGHDKLVGRAGADLLEGGAGSDTLYGGIGDDTLSGGAGGDWLVGDAGRDVLRGGDGSDRLRGGAGDDRLEGGRGRDVLVGGEGADTFVFDLAEMDRPDVIRDFDAAEGDRIVLTGLQEVDGAVLDMAVYNGTTYLVMHQGGTTARLAQVMGEGLEEIALVGQSDDMLVFA